MKKPNQPKKTAKHQTNPKNSGVFLCSMSLHASVPGNNFVFSFSWEMRLFVSFLLDCQPWLFTLLNMWFGAVKKEFSTNLLVYKKK